MAAMGAQSASPTRRKVLFGHRPRGPQLSAFGPGYAPTAGGRGGRWQADRAGEPTTTAGGGNFVDGEVNRDRADAAVTQPRQSRLRKAELPKRAGPGRARHVAHERKGQRGPNAKMRRTEGTERGSEEERPARAPAGARTREAGGPVGREHASGVERRIRGKRRAAETLRKPESPPTALGKSAQEDFPRATPGRRVRAGFRSVGAERSSPDPQRNGVEAVNPTAASDRRREDRATVQSLAAACR